MSAELKPEMIAAYDYVNSVVETADDEDRCMWYGWALREAFVAGARWQKDKDEKDEANK